jgi:hypothetical protein
MDLFLTRVAPGSEFFGGLALGLVSLAVTAGAGSPDSYEPDDTPDVASAIAVGETQMRSISPTGDLDWATFTLAEPTPLVIETDGPEGDTLLRLYRVNGTILVEQDDDSGNLFFSRIYRVDDQTLPAGTYHIRVNEFLSDDEISAYTLRLDVHTGPVPPTISSITNFNIVEGVPFTTPEPGLDEGTPPFAWAIEEAPVGVTIDAGTGAVTWPSPTLGIHQVVISVTNSVDIDVETFTFSVFEPQADIWEPDNTPGEAKLTIRGESRDHSIFPAGDEDWHLFSVDFPQTTILETSGFMGDTVLELYQDDGTTLIGSDDDSGDGLFSRIERGGANELPIGTYRVRIRAKDGGATISQYTFLYTRDLDVYEPDDSPAQASNFTFGSPQTHSLIPAGDEDWVRINLSVAGDMVLETSGVPGGDTRMQLLQADGQTVIEEDDDDGPSLYSRIERTGSNALPSGIYFARVYGFAASTQIESYTLTITGPASPIEPIVQFLLGHTTDQTGLNYNGDGQVDSADLVYHLLNP